MSETMSVQWFPGHMAKTRRIMASNLKLVDIVVELCDARIPQSSRNPEIDKIVGKKPRLMLLNKADCADAAATEQWLTYYRKKGIPAMACDCRSGRGVKNLLPAVREVLAEKIAAWNEKGMVGRPIRMMIVGIPNVGKSSLINRLSGTRSAKVEDRPGVTRGKQWVSLEDGVELLDMPGVLWPKFEDKVAGERLAFIGSVKDQILDIEYLAMRLLDTLRPTYTAALAERYKLDAEAIAEMESYELLERIARLRIHTAALEQNDGQVLRWLTQLGWACWTGNVDGLDDGRGQAAQANAILAAAAERGSVRITLDDGAAGAGILSRILPRLQQAGYSIRLAVESEL